MEFDLIDSEIIDSSSDIDLDDTDEIGDDERKNILDVVEECIFDQLEAFTSDSDSNPAFTYPRIENCSSNFDFDPNIGVIPKNAEENDITFSQVKFNYDNCKDKYVRMMLVLNKIHELLVKDEKVTKRELYYQLVRHEDCGSMGLIDDAIHTIVIMLQIPRSKLRILATAKGLMAGNLKYTNDDGFEIDCSNGFGKKICFNVLESSILL